MATIFISLGSNIRRKKNIRAGLDALEKEFGKLKLSSVYKSEAVGFQGKKFLNLVAKAKTTKSIADVERCFKAIENANGRERGGEKFAPRTLDIDLLLYDDVVCEKEVVLPREEILHNAFVLWPLAELAPKRRHPVLGKRYRKLWKQFDKSSQSIWPVSFKWKNKKV